MWDSIIHADVKLPSHPHYMLVLSADNRLEALALVVCKQNEQLRPFKRRIVYFSNFNIHTSTSNSMVQDIENDHFPGKIYTGR